MDDSELVRRLSERDEDLVVALHKLNFACDEVLLRHLSDHFSKLADEVEAKAEELNSISDQLDPDAPE